MSAAKTAAILPLFQFAVLGHLQALQLPSKRPVNVHIGWKSYRQTSNISRITIGNAFVDHSDVVGALPVGFAPTASSFSI